jgi:hypothetical protein
MTDPVTADRVWRHNVKTDMYTLYTYGTVRPNSIMGPKIGYPEFSFTEQDVIACFVRINALYANIDVNDNKQLFRF